MATYKQIQEYIKKKHGFVSKTCWIAYAKEIAGLPVGQAHNRKNPIEREEPCPPAKLPAIMDAFRHFEMI